MGCFSSSVQAGFSIAQPDMLTILFPDGTRLGGPQVISYMNDGGTVSVTTTNVVTTSGMHYNQIYLYKPANSDVADTIISMMDSWFSTDAYDYVRVADAIAGFLTIFTITPNNTSAGTPVSIAVTGTRFVSGATIIISNAIFTTVVADPNNLTFAYDGSLGAATYDVTITNPNGTTFTFHSGLILS